MKNREKSQFGQMVAEQKISIKKLSEETGIPRPSITAFCSGKSKGIQFKTLNKLCLYFDKEPGELIQMIKTREKVSCLNTPAKTRFNQEK